MPNEKDELMGEIEVEVYSKLMNNARYAGIDEKDNAPVLCVEPTQTSKSIAKFLHTLIQRREIEARIDEVRLLNRVRFPYSRLDEHIDELKSQLSKIKEGG